jgi:hypothetical protein
LDPFGREERERVDRESEPRAKSNLQGMASRHSGVVGWHECWLLLRLHSGLAAFQAQEARRLSTLAPSLAAH